MSGVTQMDLEVRFRLYYEGVGIHISDPNDGSRSCI